MTNTSIQARKAGPVSLGTHLRITESMEHVVQHDDEDMHIPKCSFKAIRNVWVVVVLLLEVGIFIAASAQCHWPDPGVRFAFASPSHPPSPSLARLCAPPFLSCMSTWN